MKSLNVVVLIFAMTIAQAKANDSLVGYLAYWNTYNPKKVELLTDLVLFSAQVNADGTLKIPAGLRGMMEKLQKNRPNDIKLFLCIGGWGQSKHFPAVTKDPALRKNFIDNVIKTIDEYKFDGVDYDWEHPKNLAEYNHYLALIRETKKAGTLVSLALGAQQNLPAETFTHLYKLNLMSYDMPGQHSTVEGSRKEVKRLIKMGCPADIICMGVPFYGRHITDRNKTLSYAILQKKVGNDSSDEFEGFYFNNVTTMKKKVALAKELKINGIMIWEIELDDKDMSLLTTLKNELD